RGRLVRCEALPLAGARDGRGRSGHAAHGPARAAAMTAARPEGGSIHARPIGGAWLAVARRIVADGARASYDGKPILELAHQTLIVDAPDPEAALLARHGD